MTFSFKKGQLTQFLPTFFMGHTYRGGGGRGGGVEYPKFAFYALHIPFRFLQDLLAALNRLLHQSFYDASLIVLLMQQFISNGLAQALPLALWLCARNQLVFIQHYPLI